MKRSVNIAPDPNSYAETTSNPLKTMHRTVTLTSAVGIPYSVCVLTKFITIPNTIH